MGCFDTFKAKCPMCGEINEVQSKMFECCLYQFKPGDDVTCEQNIVSMEFKAKDHGACLNCGYIPTIVIQNNKFFGFR